MGGGSWKGADWAAYSDSKAYDTKKPEEVINTTRANKEFLPVNFKGGRRESRDSIDNPDSTAIAVFGDVTGSMGRLAGLLIKEGMATFISEVHARKLVTSPHIMAGAIGDLEYDSVPIQATQFEADIRLNEQLEQLYVEAGGGGNRCESYHAPWLLGALMTDLDCHEKRGVKGILFTYGDEEVPGPLTKAQAKQFFGLDLERDLSAEDILAMVTRKYDVYHLIIEEGNHAKYYPAQVKAAWANLLGQRAIPVKDHTKLAEVMIGVLEVTRKGTDLATTVSSFKPGTDLVVKAAIEHLAVTKAGPTTGVVTL